MRWSKLKQLIETNFVPAMAGRVAVHSTTYDGSTEGRAWVTLDKIVIADFCTRAHERQTYGLGPQKEKPDLVTAFGEMSRQQVYQACWEYLHEIAFEDALVSDNPMLQALAVLDKRLGKRRYAKVHAQELHPLARRLLDARLEAEGVRPTPA